MMSILVLNGSPKAEKSNTMRLTNNFLEGAGWKEIEIIHLVNKEIRNCTGCFSCWNKTPGKCVIKDDMSEILEKIISADTIIWSFPLYYYNVPGIMGTVFSSYTVLVSGVLLAVMGIFTVWFQKWYPRKLINDMK